VGVAMKKKEQHENVIQSSQVPSWLDNAHEQGSDVYLSIDGETFRILNDTWYVTPEMVREFKASLLKRGF
jgi:hypothetical protein